CALSASRSEPARGGPPARGPGGRSPRGWSAPPTARTAPPWTARTAPAATPTGWGAPGGGAPRGPSRAPRGEPSRVREAPAVQNNQLLDDAGTTFDEPPPELDPGLKEERFEPGDEES